LHVTEWFFPPDHPASEGHFPGNPVIPGAVLLRDVLRAIQKDGGLTLPHCRIQSTKFLHPVRPGDRIMIERSRSADGDVRFACRIGARLVLTGQVRCHAVPSAD
jgi:3-hydroxymyristoyl/3-hydroxydecanoyl-(acyl carrier protein) dehydratase